MKTKKEATLVARHWNTYVYNGNEATKTKAQVVKLSENFYQVEIRPTGSNDGTSFHRTAELGAYDTLNLSTYIKLRDGKMIGVIM